MVAYIIVIKSHRAHVNAQMAALRKTATKRVSGVLDAKLAFQ